MTTGSHPQQRSIPILALAPTGFISGTIHIPALKGLHAFLNGPEEILKLTEAKLLVGDLAFPFLALQKSATHLIVPREPLELGPGYMTTKQHLVTCLLNMGSIRGTIEILESVRTSDFLLRNHGFIPFRNCLLGPDPHIDPAGISGDPLPLVFVNSNSMVGVMEEIP